MNGNDAQRGTSTPEPIAIIGIGCRFPGGAHGPDAFWDLLAHGIDAIREVPPDRWDPDAFYDPDGARPGTAVTRWGGFVDRPIGAFDAMFFGMSPREAAHLDPMQRWLLEVSWEAMEDAGVVPARLEGSPTGVYVGVFTEDTKLFQLGESNRALIGSHTGTGTAMTMAANRISYWFDLRGPSVSLDTACSSSLIAVHLACQSLWTGESTLALAGGANAMFRPEYTIAESKAGMLSPDGRCKTFDAGANGYVRGEGAGMVVLKPLAAARADGDRIYAVIRGTAANQDGRTSGITVPNGDAQKALMREACRRAGLTPADIGYMEAHGTGTPVGDPIEARALGEVLGEERPQGDPCLVGSVKTNVGHLEAAAGVAGLIKAALCIHRRQIPPHLHLRTPNPEIDFDALNLRVCRRLESWPGGARTAVAAVNSFGFGGANAHAILSEPPAAPGTDGGVTPGASRHDGEDGPCLVPLSARSRRSLRRLVEIHRDRAREDGDGSPPSVADLAAAAALRRSHHPHRVALTVADRRELAETLDAFLEDGERPGLAHGTASPRAADELAFVFTGMGPQWWAMGRELLAAEPVFRNAVERCDAILGRLTDWSLLAEMGADEGSSRMAETWLSQPANFAVQVGLTELLRSWGIEPAAVVGHSTGEVAAFWAAGVMDLEEACRVVYHRSRLQQTTSGQGCLVAVGLPVAEVEQLLEGVEGVSVAAVNSPGSVTLSGDGDTLHGLVAPLQEGGVFCRFLDVQVPFHSHYMEAIRGELIDSLDPLALAPARVPLYSTVTGVRAAGQELDSAYWWRNVRDPVHFARAARAMLADGCRTFLEVGPHPVLRHSLGDCMREDGVEAAVLPTLRRGDDERRALLATVGALYARGVEPDWRALHPGDRRFVELPRYPWDREVHWDESADSRRDRLEGPEHPLLGRRRGGAQPAWRNHLGSTFPAYLQDHRVEEAVVFPGAGFVEMGVAALRAASRWLDRPLALQGVTFDQALFLPEEGTVEVEVAVDDERLDFAVYSRRGDEPWRRHAAGALAPMPAAGPCTPLADLEWRLGSDGFDADLCYQGLAGLGLNYGPRFRNLARVSCREREVLGRIDVGAGALAPSADYEMHPALLDACFQTLLVGPALTGELTTSYLPVRIDRLEVYGRLTAPLWVHGRIDELTTSTLRGDLEIYGDGGELLAAVRGIRAQSLDAGAGIAFESLFYEQQWRLLELPAGAPPDGAWLLLADRGGAATALAARLADAGATPILVEKGEEFSASPDRHAFRLSPGDGDHYRRLLGELPVSPSGIVHLWNLDAPPPEELSGDDLMAAQVPGCISLLHLLRALQEREPAEPPRLWVATRGARSAPTVEHPLAVAQAPVWGFAVTLFQQERPDLAGAVVDLDPRRPATAVDELFAVLAAGAPEPQLAVRDGAVWAERLVPAPEMAKLDGAPPRFRSDASYLITGGMGGLGLLFARWMVERGARHLLLAGRTPLPARDDWGAVDPGSRLGRRVVALRELEGLGASVEPVVLDVGDEAAVAAFLDLHRRRGRPPIRGVLHAAGVAIPRMVSQLQDEEFLSTLRPKLAAWTLHRLLAAEPLDQFVLFSSVAAQGFSMGMSDYAAGNAFLDALAEHRSVEGVRALAVDWGAWGEVGMGGSEQVSRDFVRRGLLPIPPRQGVRALERLFEAGLPRVTCVGADWPRMLRRNYPTAEPPPFLEPVVQHLAEIAGPAEADEGGEDVRQRLAAAGDESEARKVLEEQLHEVTARVLRLDPQRLDSGTPMSAFGLDSLLAVELRNRIEAAVGAGPTVVELLQGASVAGLAGHLLPRVLDVNRPVDDGELSELMMELEDLPEEQVRTLLDEDLVKT